MAWGTTNVPPPYRRGSNARAAELLEDGFAIVHRTQLPPGARPLEPEPVPFIPQGGVVGEVLTRTDDLPFDGHAEWQSLTPGGQPALTEDDADLLYVKLVGDTMTGTLGLPPGGLLAPALALGAADGTGFYRTGIGTVGIGIQGAPVWLFNPTMSFARQELDMGNFSIHSLLDPISPTDAANKRYVDLMATLDLYQGEWQVAANIPDITIPPPPSLNGARYMCRTADPAVAEIGPPGIPGVSGEIVNDGDYIIWSTLQGIWAHLISGSLTKAQADTLYLSLDGGTVDGAVRITELLTLEQDAYIDGHFAAPSPPT